MSRIGAITRRIATMSRLIEKIRWRLDSRGWLMTCSSMSSMSSSIRESTGTKVEITTSRIW